MNKIFIVACKTLGLIQLYWALASLVQIGTMFNIGKNIPADRLQINYKFYLALIVVYGILNFFFAFMMIFETETIARIVGLGKKDDIPHLPPQSILMKSGLMLMGIFFLLESIPNLAKTITRFYLFVKMNKGTFPNINNSEYWVELIPVLCQIGLAILILVKPDAILRLIFGKKETA